MAAIDAEALFEVYGFVKQENGLWRFWKEFSLDEEMNRINKEIGGTRSTMTIVEEREDGRFFGYVVEGAAAPVEDVIVPEKATYYPSRDPRDMIALACDGVANAYSNSTGDFVDDGFEAKGYFVTQPFRSEDDFFDYSYTDKAMDPYWRLKAPTSEYGSAYTAWRDEFCEKLLESVSSPKM